MYCRPAFRLHYLFLLLYGCPIGQRTVLGLRNLQRGPQDGQNFADGSTAGDIAGTYGRVCRNDCKRRISRYGTAA